MFLASSRTFSAEFGTIPSNFYMAYGLTVGLYTAVLKYYIDINTRLYF